MSVVNIKQKEANEVKKYSAKHIINNAWTIHHFVVWNLMYLFLSFTNYILCYRPSSEDSFIFVAFSCYDFINNMFAIKHLLMIYDIYYYDLDLFHDNTIDVVKKFGCRRLVFIKLIQIVVSLWYNTYNDYLLGITGCCMFINDIYVMYLLN